LHINRKVGLVARIWDSWRRCPTSARLWQMWAFRDSPRANLAAVFGDSSTCAGQRSIATRWLAGNTHICQPRANVGHRPFKSRRGPPAPWYVWAIPIYSASGADTVI